MSTTALSVPSSAQIEGANFLNLLIVDDERAIREVCRDVAQSLAFNTVVADSAEHAYRMLETQNIDVVLLDLKLPGAGGLEALHQIGQRKPDAVTVVVTGYGTVQSAVQAMKNGAYDYVTKPFSMEELRGSHTDRERIVRLRQRSIHRGGAIPRWITGNRRRRHGVAG